MTINLKEVLRAAEYFSDLNMERTEDGKTLNEFEAQLYEMACRFSTNILKMNNIVFERQIREMEEEDNASREPEASGTEDQSDDKPTE